MTEIKLDAWHAKMSAAGWKAERDLFQNIVRYTYDTGHGQPLVLEAVHFSMWAGLQQTPTTAPF